MRFQTPQVNATALRSGDDQFKNNRRALFEMAGVIKEQDKMSNIIEEVKEEDLKSPNTRYSNMGQSAGG